MALNINERRSIVQQVLKRTLKENTSLSQTLDAVLDNYQGTHSAVLQNEKNWIQEMVSGVLRWKGRLDYIVDHYSQRKKASGDIRWVLMMGIYQILNQKEALKPKIVSESVEWVKKNHGLPSSKFVNAVLRKITKEVLSDPKMHWEQAESSFLSLPEWMTQKLIKQHGREWTIQYGLKSLERPSLWLRSCETALSLGYLEMLEAGPISKSWKKKETTSFSELKIIQDKKAYVQDISNQKLISDISEYWRKKNLMDNDKLSSGSDSTYQIRALDLCAAPGGKSIGLAWEGFCVDAYDINLHRLERLKENIKNFDNSQKIHVVSDETDLAPASYDLVWVDPPCSSSGVIRKHPEIRWTHSEKDLPHLQQQQCELLQKGWGFLKLKGVLIYSVCSIFKEEGEDVFEKIKLTLGDYEIINQWFLSPHEFPHGDGFWAIALKKLTII